MRNRIEESVANGETRRVIAISGHHVGLDAIVEFGDLDSPGTSYTAVVYAGHSFGGLEIGDECILRYRAAKPGTHKVIPPGWEFVAKVVEESPIEEPVCA
jgi:hypothetical protein